MTAQLSNRRKNHNRRYSHKLQTPIEEASREYKQAVHCTGLTQKSFNRKLRKILGVDNDRQPISELL